jgi:Tol biopolymer transport system component/DNA-binding winged helix-turn-helix (wHTH) protein
VQSKSPENGLKNSQNFQIKKMSEPQRFFEFDNFLLDSQQRLLLRDGQPVELTPKVFDVLFELVQSGGRVVEKKELMERIWPNSFVEEANLTQHVSTLRKKLGHDAQQRYILTVPGRGDRFVAPIKSWDDDAVVTVQERVRSRISIGNPDESIESDEIIPAVHRALPAGPGQRPRMWGLIAIAIGVMLVVLIGLSLLNVLRRRNEPFTNIRLSRFTTNGKVTAAAISPNGKQVAYAEAEGGQQTLWIRQVATSNTGVVVVGASNVGYDGLTFSPDSDYIYYIAAPLNTPNTLYRVPALGGKPSALVEDVDSAPTFSPDGKQMAYLRGYPDALETVLMIANVDGTGEKRLSTLKAPQFGFTLGPAPGWSPDGKHITCSVSVSDKQGQYQEVYQVDPLTGATSPLTNRKWRRVQRVAWMRDGSRLIMTAAESENTELQVWEVSYPSGEPRKITNDLNEYRALTLTADSKTAAVVQTDQQANVWIAPAIDGRNAVQITSNNYDGLNGLAWTPDGRLLYTSARNEANDIFMVDAQGKERIQLTEKAGNNTAPAMSPDGRTIVFVSTRDGQQHLWSMAAAGGRVQRLTEGQQDMSPVFSPDGQTIIYRSYVTGNPNLFRLPVGGGGSTRLTEVISGPPAISPDGKTIACIQRPVAIAKVKIALVPLDGSSPRIIEPTSVPRRAFLVWTHDGQSLAYIKNDSSISNLWLLPLNGGEPKQITNFDSNQIFNFAISTDGRLALSRGNEKSDVVLISSSQ